MVLQENTPAPDFSLKDKEGRVHTLSKIRSSFVIVYFYPKDDTSGCTIEAIEFSAQLAALRKLGAEVIGISGGNEETKRKFCDKHNLKVTLLSDPDFIVCKKYGVYGEKIFLGKNFLGIKRTTFIIQRGNIVKVFEGVSANGHADEVMEFLKTIRN
ncbi:MAG: hypothetical protein RL557_204 [archaeon]|jgi:peroxiredoxin Q/BCP